MRIFKTVYADHPPYWVACIGPDKLVYAFVAATNRFHYSDFLDVAYSWDEDIRFVEIQSNEAVELINAGLGTFDESKASVVQRLVESESSFSAQDVLGDAANAITVKNEED